MYSIFIGVRKAKHIALGDTISSQGLSNLFKICHNDFHVDKYLKILCSQIETRLNWGPAAHWQGNDFRKLSELIFKKTAVSLSESTLRRIFGKAAYPHLPSETTLNTLSAFADYGEWRTFQQQVHFTGDPGKTEKAKKGKKFKISIPLWAAACLLLLGLILFLSSYLYNRGTKNDPISFMFSARSITTSIPNSVVFTYHVKSRKASPVYIQQSWDPSRRMRVPPSGNEYSSMYYRPGFFQAKLIVGNQVVKEYPLLIPTDGWIGMIDQSPVPVYLEKKEFQTDTSLSLNSDQFSAHHISLEPKTPRVEFYNVGGFQPVSLTNMKFSALVRSDFNKGSGVCTKVQAALITDGVPVTFALSAKGCVATLKFLNGSNLVTAGTADLSGFGADLDTWVPIGCYTDSGKLFMLINQRIVYSCPLPQTAGHVVGIEFSFEGGGAAKKISLSEKGKRGFSAF